MKKIQITLAVFSMLLFASCGNSTSEHNHEGHTHGTDEHSGHEHETYFTCEQHPDVHEHSSGKCPKCQMELVQKEGEAHEHDDHAQEAYYTCSNHPGVHEHDPGVCPTCKKELVKKEGEKH